MRTGLRLHEEGEGEEKEEKEEKEEEEEGGMRRVEFKGSLRLA